MTGEEMRKKLRAGERVFGTHITYLGGPYMAERNTRNPLDFVFIDTEHTAIGRAEVGMMCQYYAARGISPIVRIPYPNGHLAAQAVDAGAQGVVVPYIETVAEVREVAGALRYRPLKGQYLREALSGERPLKPSTVQYLQEYNRHSYLIIGIESIPAIERLEELMGVPGVDGVFIGPHDLSVSMEIPEQYSHPDFENAVRDIIRRSRQAGLGVGMHLFPKNFPPETIQGYVQDGMNWILYARDTDLMGNSLAKEIEGMKEWL